jgi:hypothetical protein
MASASEPEIDLTRSHKEIVSQELFLHAPRPVDPHGLSKAPSVETIIGDLC